MGAGFAASSLPPIQGRREGRGNEGLGGTLTPCPAPSSVHYSVSCGFSFLCLPGFKRTELGEERLKMRDAG